MNWDDLKIFLAVSEAPSMRAAAKQMKVSHTKVSRRIEALEAELKVKLFNRVPEGYNLTPSGQELLPIALQMEDQLHAFGRSVKGREDTLEGQVCVTIPDVAVTHIFLPYFLRFMEEHPKIQIKIEDSNEVFDLSRGEADVAIRMTKTPPPHLIGRCFGNVHQAAYATRDYIQENCPDVPNSTAHWIGWGQPEASPFWLKNSPFPHLGIRGHYNSILIQYEAAKQSAGIGRFPCFLGDQTPELIRLSDPVPTYELWLLSHCDLRAAARMRAFRHYIMSYIPDIKDRLEGKKGKTIACADV